MPEIVARSAHVAQAKRQAAKMTRADCMPIDVLLSLGQNASSDR